MQKHHYAYSQPKYGLLLSEKKFPEDIECIMKSSDSEKGSLYISNVEAASNPLTLRKLKIGAILSCAKGYKLQHPATLIPFYKYIPTIDHQACDLSIHFEEAVDFIKNTLSHTNLLVHCIAGVSRSVSMVLAYLIKELNMTYDQAYHFVKSKRKIIHPNDGFIAQLKRYHKEHTAKQKDLSNHKPKNSEDQLSSNHLTPTNKNRDQNHLASTKGHSIYYSSSASASHVKKYESNHPYASSPKKQVQYTYNHVSPKHSKHIQGSPAQEKESNVIQRTATMDFYTPSKSKMLSSNNLEKNKEKQTFLNYQNFSKSTLLDRYNVPLKFRQDKKYFGERSEELKKDKEYSPYKNNNERINKTFFDRNEERKTNLDFMNKELNEKIDEIRKKYERERQNLYNKFSTKNQSKDNSKLIQKAQFKSNNPEFSTLNHYNEKSANQKYYYDKNQRYQALSRQNLRKQLINEPTLSPLNTRYKKYEYDRNDQYNLSREYAKNHIYQGERYKNTHQNYERRNTGGYRRDFA